MATATKGPEDAVELTSSSDGETIENQQQTNKDWIVIEDIAAGAQQQQPLNASRCLQTPDICQDIQIHSSHTGIFDNHKSKIEQLFHVKLEKRELTQTDKSEPGSISTVQWIQLKGSQLDCKDASEYIRSLCNAAVFTQFEYDPSLHDAIGNNSLACERIERQTKAVLFELVPGQMHIQGDELTIALAVSLLEELVLQNSTDCKSVQSTRRSLLDNMLNEKLPSGDDDASYKSHVHKIPEEVKRSMLRSIDDSEKLEELVKNQANSSSGMAAKPASSISNPMDQYFKSVAAKKGYSDAEALEVLSQSSQPSSDADFIRRLSTARRLRKPVADDDSMLLNSEVSTRLNDTKISSSSNPDWSMQDDTNWIALGANESEDTSVICLRSDDEELELRTASSRQLRGTEGSSAAAAIVVPSDDETTSISHGAPVSGNVKSKKTGGNVVNTGSKMDTGSKYDDLDLISLPVSVNPSSKKGKRTVTQENAVRVTKPNSSARPSAFSQQPVVYQNPLPAPAVFLHSRDLSDAIPSHSKQTGGGGRAFAVGDVSSSSSRHEERLQFGSGPKLRYVVIDGSNVAMSHSNGKYFSCRGIQIVVQYFRKRGHSKITAFVPQWRRQTSLSREYPIKDQELLDTLLEEGFLVFSPSRRVGNRNITPYDDRFILDLAVQTEGVVVSNDNYRDLYDQKQEFREVIEKRLLPYSFVGDIFMIPDDPLGRNGPNLDQFLTMPSKESGPLHPSPVQAFFGASPTIHSYHSTAASNPPFGGATTWTRPPLAQSKTPAAPVQDSGWPYLPAPQQAARSGSHRGNVVQNKSVQHKPRSAGGPQSQQQQSKPGHQNVKSGNALRSPEMTAKVRSQLLEVFSESVHDIDRLLLKYPHDNNVEKLSALLISEMETAH